MDNQLTGDLVVDTFCPETEAGVSMAYELSTKASQPLTKFHTLSEFLESQISWCYLGSRSRYKWKYEITCARCSKSYKWTLPLMVHTIAPDNCRVLEQTKFALSEATTCQICGLVLASDALEYHMYIRHLSLLVKELDDNSIRQLLMEMIQKYIVVNCDRCTFSVRAKARKETTVDMFIRHWKICDSSDGVRDFEVYRFVCPKCKQNFDFRAFLKHTACGYHTSFKECAVTKGDPTNPVIEMFESQKSKRTSVARGINFNDIYGLNNDQDDDKDTSFDVSAVSERTANGSMREANFSELSLQNSSVVADSLSSHNEAKRPSQSTIRRHFTQGEITAQVTNQGELFKKIMSWGTLFPNFVPRLTPYQGTVFIAENAQDQLNCSFDKVSVGVKKTVDTPTSGNSSKLNEDSFVFNVGSQPVGCCILQLLDTFYILCSTKRSFSSKYPVSERNEEEHHLQLWKLKSGDCLSLHANISTIGLLWRLKWLDMRLNMNNPKVQFFIGSSSAGHVIISPVDFEDLNSRFSRVKELKLNKETVVRYNSMKFALKADAGQCLCFDIQYVTQDRTRVIAGFSDGSIAIWSFSNSLLTCDEGADEVVVFPSMVFVAHISYVSNVVWNLYNVDHFASTCGMVEDSLKVWSLTNLNEGPLMSTTMFQIVSVVPDPLISGFIFTITHCNYLKSTFPASLLVTEEEVYAVNIRVTHHEKLERLVVTGADMHYNGQFMYVCTEEGYLFRSESRVKIYPKKAKVTSCPISTQALLKSEEKVLVFKESNNTFEDKSKFPNGETIMKFVASYPVENCKYLVCVGLKCGIVRLKFEECS